MNKLYIILLAISLTWVACQDEEPKEERPSESISQNGILVLNEGLFRQGNASLSLIDWNTQQSVDSAEVYHRMFEATTDQKLGDVGHSMKRIGNEIYVVLNNSGLIRVLSDGTNHQEFLEEKSIIQNLGSPRFIEEVDEDHILVTELYDNALKLVNKQSGAIAKKITLRGMTEELVKIDEHIYITNNKRPYVYLFDINELEISDSLFIGGYSNSIKKVGDKLVFLRNADSYKGNTAAVMEIDPVSFTITDSSVIASKTSWWYARSAAYNSAFYFVSDGRIMKYEKSEITSVRDISDRLSTPYGIFVDEAGIWLSDALDYQSEGKVFFFPHNEQESIQQFTVGIIPNAILKL